MGTVDLSTPPVDDDLAPTGFIDSADPSVIAFVEETTAGCVGDRERAVALFDAVRDGIRYDPYDTSRDPDDYRASAVLAGSQKWCVPKAVLLTAAARAAGIPARLGFADVKNHLQSRKLAENMGTDLFAWHGYSVLYLDGEWRKASPAFNRSLCERFGTKVLEFDGRTDALLHPHDEAGNRHMEYVADRGVHLDLPLDDIFATFDEIYADSSAAGTVDEMFHGD
ncbi:MAG: transglutaminase family protein [Actinomycetota bacterium]